MNTSLKPLILGVLASLSVPAWSDVSGLDRSALNDRTARGHGDSRHDWHGHGWQGGWRGHRRGWRGRGGFGYPWGGDAPSHCTRAAYYLGYCP